MPVVIQFNILEHLSLHRFPGVKSLAVNRLDLETMEEDLGTGIVIAISLGTHAALEVVSGQRGTNENTNGLIRQYFPKGTDFRQISNAELRKVVEKLNDRPRKRLGYRRPPQVFLEEYSGGLDTAGATLIV